MNKSDNLIIQYLEAAAARDGENDVRTVEQLIRHPGWRSIEQIAAGTGLSVTTCRSRCDRLYMDTVYLAKGKQGKAIVYRRR